MSRYDFTARAFQGDEDAETIARWWRESGVEPLPARAMPKLGMWAMCGENRMACAFAYLTLGDLAIMAFPIANPNEVWRAQAEALSFAITELAKYLTDVLPNVVVIGLSHDASVHQTYVKRAGFHDTGKVHLAALVPQGTDLSILTE